MRGKSTDGNESINLGKLEAKMETFEDVIQRIIEVGFKYMTAKEFLEYFSEKGKPVDQLEINQSMMLKKQYSGAKVKMGSDFSQPFNDGIDGYDSDPELYSSQLLKKVVASPKKGKK